MASLVPVSLFFVRASCFSNELISRQPRSALHGRLMSASNRKLSNALIAIYFETRETNAGRGRCTNNSGTVFISVKTSGSALIKKAMAPRSRFPLSYSPGCLSWREKRPNLQRLLISFLSSSPVLFGCFLFSTSTSFHRMKSKWTRHRQLLPSASLSPLLFFPLLVCL